MCGRVVANRSSMRHSIAKSLASLRAKGRGLHTTPIADLLSCRYQGALRRRRVPERDRHSRRLVRPVRWSAVCESDADLKCRVRHTSRNAKVQSACGLEGGDQASGLVPLFAAYFRSSPRSCALLARSHCRPDARRARPRHVRVPFGNGVDPVDIANRMRRRNRAALRSLHRLPRRHGRQRKPDAALRRRLPQTPRQHSKFCSATSAASTQRATASPKPRLLPLDHQSVLACVRAIFTESVHSLARTASEFHRV